MGETVPALQHLYDAAADQIGGVEPKGRLAAMGDLAFNNGAA
jgi:hypothetical protein